MRRTRLLRITIGAVIFLVSCQLVAASDGPNVIEIRNWSESPACGKLCSAVRDRIGESKRFVLRKSQNKESLVVLIQAGEPWQEVISYSYAIVVDLKPDSNPVFIALYQQRYVVGGEKKAADHIFSVVDELVEKMSR